MTHNYKTLLETSPSNGASFSTVAGGLYDCALTVQLSKTDTV